MASHIEIEIVVVLVRLKDAFLDVVDIEEELHFADGLAELRDVLNKIFLHAIRKIAQAFADHFIISTDGR